MKKKGGVIEADDLTVGDYYALYGCKIAEGPMPISGLAWRCEAVNLPYVVAQMVCDPHMPPLTFDVRYHEIMKVTDEFVRAQTPKPSPYTNSPFSQLFSKPQG